MYNESNESGFSIRDFILKVILVVLFVFLLMWLFPMPNLKPVYDRLFTENVETMKNAAKSYYTVERLPKEVNQTVKMTLDEMLAMKLLLPIVDSEDKLCDGNASYVEIMKTDTEYVVKTNLSCSNKSDYVIEHMGCYNLCGDSCKTEETTPKPQAAKPTTPTIKKIVSTTMYQLTRTWYKGYTTNSTAATTLYKHVKYGTETVFTGYSYSCPSGSSNLNGTTCYKYDSVYSYSCSSGTLTSDNKCKVAGTSYNYSCPSGYTASGSGSSMTCSKTTTSNSYSCSSGTLTSDNKCKIANTSYTYSCPSGYTASGSGSSMTCSKRVASGTTTQYAGSGSGKSIPTSNSTYKYVSTGSYAAKDCNACASYIVYTYNIYKYVTTYSTTHASPIKTAHTSYTYTAAKINTTSSTTHASPIKTAYTTYSYTSAHLNTSTRTTAVNAIATAKYDYRTYVIDSKWTYNSYEAGYTMVDKKTISGTSKVVYTPDWVLTLPSGYTKTETRAEYKWSNKSSESGWTFTGVTKKVTK